MSKSVAIALISTVYLDSSVVCASAFPSSIYAEFNRNYSILSVFLISCASSISPQRVSTWKRHSANVCTGCFT